MTMKLKKASIWGIAAVFIIAAGAYAPAVAQVSQAAKLNPVETQIMGSGTWAIHSAAALRIAVNNHVTKRSLQATVRVSIAPAAGDKISGKTSLLFTKRTNASGIFDARFQTPTVPAGSYRLLVDVDTQEGQDHIERSISIEDARKILLTTDKPVYQPGQTIHMRALVIDSATQHPAHTEPITFDVTDGRQNKVYVGQTTLSKYGIASLDFALADQVNEGAFTVSASTVYAKSDKSVRVEHYTLPKYSVKITTDRPYYLRNDVVHGVVEAHYFYGKPVASAAISIIASGSDAGPVNHVDLHGTTDNDGKYQFDYKVPETFTGDSFMAGQAVISVDATVTDAARHSQTTHFAVPAVPQAAFLTLIPEHSYTIPGIPNRIFIALSTPDGLPIKRSTVAVTITEPDPEDKTLKKLKKSTTEVKTDDLGIASLEFESPEHVTNNCGIAASYTDDKGRRSTEETSLYVLNDAPGIVLQTDRTFAKIGETVRLTAVTTSDAATVYFDIVRDGQTQLTRTVSANFGTAAISIPLSQDMSGTLRAHAYAITQKGDIIQDTRTIIVSPLGDLKVSLSSDANEYRPGSSAHVRIAVTDRNNKAAPSAVGVTAVDESVYALTDTHPGLERMFFTLAKELMQPGYEINGLTPIKLYDEAQISEVGKQRAGAMLLTSAAPLDQSTYIINSYQIRFDAIKAGILDDMKIRYIRVDEAMRKYNDEHDFSIVDPDLTKYLYEEGLISQEDYIDPWGTPYRIRPQAYRSSLDGFRYTSAGPDRILNTWDDLTVQGQASYGLGATGGFGGGGFGGGGFGGGVVEAEQPAPPPAATAVGMNALATPRIRSFFPETLFWEPQVITDDTGHTDIPISLADSITSWRVSAIAGDSRGLLGSADIPLKVFQDFFLDVDVPPSLTQGDSVTVPVAVYNYLPAEQDVTVSLAPAAWFDASGPLSQRIHIGANDAGVVKFRITARHFGSGELLFTALGTKMSDAVKRSVEILPYGRRQQSTASGPIQQVANATVAFPDEAILGASSLKIKVYPEAIGEILDGVDNFIDVPDECFNGSSTETYVNALALRYLKSIQKGSPAVQAKAELHIALGYQKLVTFEAKEGGFSWLGKGDGNLPLTSFALLLLNDMTGVHRTDHALIERTQKWLAGRQKANGSWVDDQDYGTPSRIDNLRVTAAITWSLAESGYIGQEVDRGIRYLSENERFAKDSYTLAYMLCALTSTGEHTDESAEIVANKLIALARTTDSTAYWSSSSLPSTTGLASGYYDEVTALATYALLKYRQAPAVTEKAVRFLRDNHKDCRGFRFWSEDAIWTLKALLLAPVKDPVGSEDEVDISINGGPAKIVKLNDLNRGVVQLIDATRNMENGTNTIRLTHRGTALLSYQVTGEYIMPWERSTRLETDLPPDLALTVSYDKTVFSVNDNVGARITVRNITDRTAAQPLLDIGIPPGFDVDSTELDAAVAAGRISKYSIASQHLIVYIDHLEPNASQSVLYHIHPRSAMKVLTPASAAYPYFHPTAAAILGPQQLEAMETL